VIKHKAAFYYYTAFAYFPPIRARLFVIWIFGKPTLSHAFFLLKKSLYSTARKNPPYVKGESISPADETALSTKMPRANH
jgi:hypothetical protein